MAVKDPKSDVSAGLSEATARDLIRALDQNSEELHEHGELLGERNLLDIEAERARKKERQAAEVVAALHDDVHRFLDEQ